MITVMEACNKSNFDKSKMKYLASQMITMSASGFLIDANADYTV